MTDDRVERAEALLAQWNRGNAPGLVVSVEQHGRTLLRCGLGLGSLDAGVVNSPATRMRIGSTTKHFTCLLVLLLRDEGRLTLDEPISRWLAELAPSQGRRTLRQLMTHTSGLRDYLDLSMISNGKAVLPAEAPLEYQRYQLEENFPAGEQFLYSNGNYRLLSLVIERVLGRPLASAFSDYLFEPLGLRDTTLWERDDEPLAGAAGSHLALPGGGFRKSNFPTEIKGEGGIAATVDDMQRWARHLLAPTRWPRSILDELVAGARLTNGHVSPYGLGLVRERWRGVDLVHHAGGVIGGSSQMLIAPEHGIQIVVMSNRSDVSAADVALRLLGVLLGGALEPEDAPADADLAEVLAGDYYCAATSESIRIARVADQITLQPFGIPVGLPLLKANDGSLRVNLQSIISMDVRMVGDGGGAVRTLEIVEQGYRKRFERVTVAEAPSAAALECFAGRWRSSELAADVEIGGERPSLMSVRGRYGHMSYTLIPVADDACLMRSDDPAVPMQGTVTRRVTAGEAAVLVVNTARTRNLRLLELKQ